MDLKKLKYLFISEAEDLLEKLNAGILKLEKNPEDKDLLNELMRYSHTMKSSAATMGYKSMSSLTHVMEDVFDTARKNNLRLSSKDINSIFMAVDSLERSVNTVKKSDDELDLEQVINNIKALSLAPSEGNLTESIKTLATPVEQEKTSHIKVPVERLDMLLNLTEELVIDKMRFASFRGLNPELREVMEHFSRLVSDIQYQVMQVRLVPVEQVFIRFPRMVRDLAEVEQKKIDLEMSGTGLELDRVIIDKLAEPLVHLIRNAIDHGIEKQGKIYIKAMREKEYALITVEDDGNGINFEKVKQVAVERNIITKTAADSMGKQELNDLLFHPNLSTKEQITETSGRGVGLSAVKNFVDQVGGRVIVESPLPHGGTRFTLELPLTLAIINALLVGIKDSLFAIPFSSIERSVSITTDNIKSMADQDVAIVDSGEVPLVRIDKMFGLGIGDPDHLKLSTVVLVRRGEDIAGIVVDKLVSEQEIITKPLPPVLRRVKGFSGSTILGDGKTVLILDVKSLLEDTKKLVRTN